MSRIKTTVSDGNNSQTIVLVGPFSVSSVVDTIVGISAGEGSLNFLENIGVDITVATPESEWIESVTYNQTSRRLSINKTDGVSLTYRDVPVFEFQGILEADSAGQFYNREIKHSYTLVR